jgi:NAD(P)H-hydrate epimerase
MKILTATQMREVDRLTTAEFGIPSLLLMENAGSGFVREMERHLAGFRDRRIVVCCGKGNNGGDGFVVARHLLLRGVEPKVLLFGSPNDVKGDALTNLEILKRMGVTIQVVEERGASEDSLKSVFRDLNADVIVDALLGTGVRVPVTGFLADVIRQIAQFPRVLAVDIPSGLDCDAMDAHPEALAPRAELTITFTAPKPAHVFAASGAVGRWVVIPIGSPQQLMKSPDHWLNFFVKEEAAETFLQFKRKADSHKGDFGHVAAIAGSIGKTGAACMVARTCLVAGSGLVTVATPAPCLPIIAAQTLEVMTEPLESTDIGTLSTKAFDYGRVDKFLEGKDVLAIGPGLGGHPETVEFVRRLLSETKIPAVVDADGLNAFVGKSVMLAGMGRILILTPHPGEFARLLGRPTSEVQADRIGLTRQFALSHQAHVVLKGHRTVYAAPSGQVFINPTGNPGMSTGGSGDVLTGLIAGLLGQGIHLPAFNGVSGNGFLETVIALAVYLHGMAGDLAAKNRGQKSMIASDIIENVPAAFLETEHLASSTQGSQ